MEQLARLTNLTSLSIRRSPALTDKRLRLERLPKLVDLGLLDLGITDDGLKQVAALAGLRSLDLRGDSQLTNAGLERLLAIRGLKTLRLGGYQVDDDTLSLVSRFTKLSGLTIDEAAVTDAGLSRIAGLPLQEITLVRCFSITDEAFQRLGSFPRLRQLVLQGIPLERQRTETPSQ